MKRQRGRNRNHNNHNKNNNNPNRSLDSNGPDGKVRGNASTIYEKYTSLARDAKTSGSRVKAENFLQHAEHYLRLMNVQETAKQAARAERESQEAARAAKEEQRHGNKEQGKNKERQTAKTETPEAGDALEVVTPSANNDGANPAPEEAPKRRRKAPARKTTETETVDAAE